MPASEVRLSWNGAVTPSGRITSLSVVLVGTTVGVTWAFASALNLDAGATACLLSGGASSSTALGTATSTATEGLSDVTEARADELAEHAKTAYALTYLLGTVLVIWFLPAFGPRLLRVNLRDECRKLEESMGLKRAQKGPGVSAYHDVVTRAYEVPPDLVHKRVAAFEALWPPPERATGAVIALVPYVATILVGNFVTRTHPGVLLGICAGAGTSAAALAELEKRAQSKIPTLGYGLSCAVGNVLFALSGTLLMLFGSH
jgi:uncharacterized transporter YbjL